MNYCHGQKANFMKSILSRTLVGLAALTPLVAGQAAIFVNGVVTFAGVALLDNANSALATQAGVFSPTVVGVAGDFSPTISVGDTPVFTSPLVLGATPATIWTAGGFSFTPTAPLTGGGGPNNTFAIGTVGIVDDGPGGYDPTPAIFALSTTPTIGGLGAFGAITAAAGPGPNVPEPQSYALLAGLGLAGFAGYRRFRG